MRDPKIMQLATRDAVADIQSLMNQAKAARAMLATLKAVMAIPSDHDGSTYAVAIPNVSMDAIDDAIAAAEAAGITAEE